MTSDQGKKATEENKCGIKDALSSIDTALGILFKIVLLLGSIIVMGYWVVIGYFPKGVTLADTILFVVSFFAFTLVYGLFLLFGAAMSFWMFPVIHLISSQSRKMAARHLHRARSGEKLSWLSLQKIKIVKKVSLRFKNIRHGFPRRKFPAWAKSVQLTAFSFFALILAAIAVYISNGQLIARNANLIASFFASGTLLSLTAIYPAKAVKANVVMVVAAILLPLPIGEPIFLIERAMASIGIQSRGVILRLDEENFKTLEGVADRLQIPVLDCRVGDERSRLVYGVDVLWTGIGETALVKIANSESTSSAKLELRSSGVTVVKPEKTYAPCFQLKADALFALKKWKLNENAPILEKLRKQIKETQNIERIVVTGHADAIPSTNPDNATLSERRAEAVKIWMVQNLDIPESAIEASGEGSAKPLKVYNSKDEQELQKCHAANRRVEIRVTVRSPRS